MLCDSEDGDIIATFLRCKKKWSRAWRARYAITDDSAAERRAIRLAFPGLQAGEQEVDHFLCRTHSERTLNLHLAREDCKKSKDHLYTALYLRKSKLGCEESINAAIEVAPDDKTRKYIVNEWWKTRALWANYARQHSCILLQCMTTNAVESWHHSIKQHAEGELTIPLDLGVLY